jgi:hypothetical protein
MNSLGKELTLMRIKHFFVILIVLALATPLGAQMGMGMRAPNMSGVWHPVVGSGGAYESTDRDGKKTPVEATVVGKEDVNGKPGYWMEMAVTSPRMSGEMFLKYLFVLGDNGLAASRVIMQLQGQDPMEMDANILMAMGGRRGEQPIPSDIRDKSELVGTETITVPAGTFSCDHYRMKDGSSEAWVSDKVSPWGLVKEQNKESSLVLTKIITDAKDHITGTPRKFNPADMMRGMGKPGQ